VTRAADSLRSVLVGLLLASSACGAETAPPARGEVGVAPFAVNAAAGASLPDVASELAAKLATLGVGGVVPPAEVGPEATSPPTPAERAALQARTGAHKLVLGSATRVGQALSLDARVLDLASGRELGLPLVEQASGDADLPRAIDALAARIAARLAEPVPTGQAPATAVPKKKKRAPGEPREPIAIQGDQLDAETVAGGRRLAFSGNVDARQGEVHLTCDRLEAFYPTGASQPDQIVARGNVRVEQGERTARCLEAVFHRAEDRIVCTGQPAELTERCSRAEAEKITFYLETEKLEMVRGKVFGRECAESPPQ
jgi:lipopolysaccharide transport protein LptA